MDACPDFIGVVKIFAFLELEPQLNIKHRFNGAGKIEHFSKASLFWLFISLIQLRPLGYITVSLKMPVITLTYVCLGLK